MNYYLIYTDDLYNGQYQRNFGISEIDYSKTSCLTTRIGKFSTIQNAEKALQDAEKALQEVLDRPINRN